MTTVGRVPAAREGPGRQAPMAEQGQADDAGRQGQPAKPGNELDRVEAERGAHAPTPRWRDRLHGGRRRDRGATIRHAGHLPGGVGIISSVARGAQLCCPGLRSSLGTTHSSGLLPSYRCMSAICGQCCTRSSHTTTATARTGAWAWRRPGLRRARRPARFAPAPSWAGCTTCTNALPDCDCRFASGQGVSIERLLIRRGLTGCPGNP